MPSQMWFTDDLRNILLSLNVASAAAARFSDPALVVAYRQGFEEAVESVAVALGIAPGGVGLHLAQTARRDQVEGAPRRLTVSEPGQAESGASSVVGGS